MLNDWALPLGHIYQIIQHKNGMIILFFIWWQTKIFSLYIIKPFSKNFRIPGMNEFPCLIIFKKKPLKAVPENTTQFLASLFEIANQISQCSGFVTIRPPKQCYYGDFKSSALLCLFFCQ